jgi:hypothetical protein
MDELGRGMVLRKVFNKLGRLQDASYSSVAGAHIRRSDGRRGVSRRPISACTAAANASRS